MNAGVARPAGRMTVEEYLAWAETQPKGRYELVDGVPFQMSPERNRHVVVKGSVFVAFRDAVRNARLPYVVLTDGPTVVIDHHRSREPDLVVQSAKGIDLDAVTADSPVVLVEVTSPSTMRTDTDDKLIEYFSLASVRHYVLVHPDRRRVVHHRRDESGAISTEIKAAGVLVFDHPGFSVSVSDLFIDLDPVAA